MIKTSKEIWVKSVTAQFTMAIEIESDGSMTISTIGVTPYLGQRFTFTQSETKDIAKALNKYI